MYNIESILSEDHLHRALADAVQDGAKPAFLRSVKIKLTARCNLRCSMCRYGKGLSLPELSTQRWLELLTQMADLGCSKVHFSGGEVLVRRDFEQLASHAAALRMKVTLTSNLTLMQKERAKALMRVKISSISTSLDGATAKTHDSIRGIAGSFHRTLKALEHLQRERDRRGRRTRFRINFVMMRRNFSDYPDLLSKVGPLGVADVIPMPVDSRDKKIRLRAQDISHYNSYIAPQVQALRASFGLPMHDARIYPFGPPGENVEACLKGKYANRFYRKRLCYAPYMHMFVAWDGKVYLCCMTNGRIDPLGDLSQQSVQDVFSGQAFSAIREQMLGKRLKDCQRCDMYLSENRLLHKALGHLRPAVQPPARALDLARASQDKIGRVRLPVLAQER